MMKQFWLIWRHPDDDSAYIYRYSDHPLSAGVNPSRPAPPQLDVNNFPGLGLLGGLFVKVK